MSAQTSEKVRQAPVGAITATGRPTRAALQTRPRIQPPRPGIIP